MKDVMQCPVCEAKQLEAVIAPHSHRAFVTRTGDMVLTIGVKLCCRCGFVFLSPRMDEQELSKYYDGQSRYTRSFEQLRQSPYDTLCAVQIDRILEEGADLSKVLEIGSAEGYFLYKLRQHGGVVEGVEPAAAYKGFHQKHYPDIAMNWTMLEDAQLQKGTYTLCVMRHVLEHIEATVVMLRHVQELLSDNGVVYIEVPNIARPQVAIYEYYHEQHLGYFTERTIRYACALAGLECVSVQQWDDNPRNSGYDYPVLRVVARRNEQAKDTVDIGPAYEESKGYVNNYLGRHAQFILEYVQPLRANVVAWNNEGKRVSLFGAGPHTAGLLQALKTDDAMFVCAFDNDQLKWGKTLGTIPIVAPEERAVFKPDVVVVSSHEFEGEIIAGLRHWANDRVKVVPIYKR